MSELVDRRVFGAIEFIDDLSETRVLSPLQIHAPGVQVLRNRSGFYVLREVDGQEAYTRAFDNPPARPPRSDLTLSVQDPTQRYLPQRIGLALPRWLPEGALGVDDADNALKPVVVRLTPAAGMPLQSAWAVLRLRSRARVAAKAPAGTRATSRPCATSSAWTRDAGARLKARSSAR